MSNMNMFFRWNEALKKRRKEVSAACTIRTGRTADAFAVDNPVEITVGANTYTVTVPDGIVLGQQIIFFCDSRTSGTVTVATTTGTDLTLDATGEWGILMWTDSTTGWVKMAGASGT